VDRETLRTGGENLTDIMENKSPDVSRKDIESKHVNESVQNLICTLRVRGRKRVKHGVKYQGFKTVRRAQLIKQDIS